MFKLSTAERISLYVTVYFISLITPSCVFIVHFSVFSTVSRPWKGGRRAAGQRTKSLVMQDHTLLFRGDVLLLGNTGNVNAPRKETKMAAGNYTYIVIVICIIFIYLHYTQKLLLLLLFLYLAWRVNLLMLFVITFFYVRSSDKV